MWISKEIFFLPSLPTCLVNYIRFCTMVTFIILLRHVQLQNFNLYSESVLKTPKGYSLVIDHLEYKRYKCLYYGTPFAKCHSLSIFQSQHLPRGNLAQILVLFSNGLTFEVNSTFKMNVSPGVVERNSCLWGSQLLKKYELCIL